MPSVQVHHTRFKTYHQRHGNMDFERQRVASFVGWTNCHVRVSDLAAAGFFYAGTLRAENSQSDLVQCYFCRIKLYDWKEGDVPWLNHARAMPRCPLMSGCTTTNTPLYSPEDLNAISKPTVAVIDADLAIRPFSVAPCPPAEK